MTTVYETFGYGGRYFFSRFRSDCFATLDTHWDTLLQIHNNCQGNSPFSFLKKDLLELDPEGMVEFSKLAGEFAWDVYAHIPIDEYQQDPSGFKAMVAQHGTGAGRIFKFIKEDVVAVEKSLRTDIERLKEAFLEAKLEERLAYSVCSLFKVHNLRANIDLLISLVPNVGSSIYDTAHALSINPRLALLPNFVVDLSLSRKRWTGAALRQVDLSLLPHCSDLYLDLAAICKSDTALTYRFLPKKLAVTHRDELLIEAVRYGGDIWGLFKSLGDNYFEQIAESRGTVFDVICQAGEEAGRFFAAVPFEKWSDLGLLTYGEGAVDFYRNRKLVDKLDPELFRESYEQFGIVHGTRYIYSGVSPKDSQYILEENLRNLDPEYKPERPIIVFAVARSDWNGSSSRGLDKYVLGLMQNARVLICEPERVDDLVVQVVRAATLFGVDKDGKPNRPLHAVLVKSHAGPEIAMFRDIDPPEMKLLDEESVYLREGSITVHHQELFRELGEYIESGGFFGVLGCQPGERVDGADSLVDTIDREIPDGLAFGATEEVSGSYVEQDGDGKITNFYVSGKDKDSDLVLWTERRE